VSFDVSKRKRGAADRDQTINLLWSPVCNTHSWRLKVEVEEVEVREEEKVIVEADSQII
jgi:hypothetical protein